MVKRKKWKNPEDIIQLKTEYSRPINRKKRIYTGATTGMNFNTWITHIFNHNELRPQNQRYTDDEIIEAILKEFPPRMTVVRELKSKPTVFGRHRSRFNKKDKPYLVSLRYGFDRYPVHHYNHCSNLSKIRSKCFIWRIIDPRFFTLEELDYVMDMRQSGDDFYLSCRVPTEQILNDHPFGSVKLGAADPDPISISNLELYWFKK
jgi:hypothetical protein